MAVSKKCCFTLGSNTPAHRWGTPDVYADEGTLLRRNPLLLPLYGKWLAGSFIAPLVRTGDEDPEHTIRHQLRATCPAPYRTRRHAVKERAQSTGITASPGDGERGTTAEESDPLARKPLHCCARSHNKAALQLCRPAPTRQHLQGALSTTETREALWTQSTTERFKTVASLLRSRGALRWRGHSRRALPRSFRGAVLVVPGTLTAPARPSGAGPRS